MEKVIWAGARKSDIKYTRNFFHGSITLYGDGKDENYSFCINKHYRINHNHITTEQTEFMEIRQLQAIKEDSDIKIMAYNPNLAYEYSNEIIKHMVCLNDRKIMHFLDSKVSFRMFAEKFVPILHSKILYGKECTLTLFKEYFSNSDSWVVQADIASGGYQTFWITEDNAMELLEKLNKDETYLVSPYYKENIPINIHAIIYKDEILLTPGSIQVEQIDRNRLLYRGADYIAYRDIDSGIRNQFEENVIIICKEIQKLGYLGIIGIDAIIVDNIVRILEVNNRFQASTLLINKVLEEQNLPSLHELNYEAFQRSHSFKVSSEQLKNLEVNYSIYAFINEEMVFHSSYILKRYLYEKSIVDFIDDGYVFSQEAEEDAYLYKLIFNTNLVSIFENKSVRIHPNIVSHSDEWYKDIVEKQDFKKIKISLLNQGVILEDSAKKYLEKHGGMRQGVYFAVDLVLDGKYIVNSPLNVKFVAISPFRIMLYDDKLFLFYYDKKMFPVKIEPADKIADKMTSKQIPVKRICLLATDRLRIQHSDFCIFKENNIPCRFCEVEYRKFRFTIEDIKEAVSLYLKQEDKKFRHILIGGLSNEIGKEKDNICEIIKLIRSHSNMPIYLMCLPEISEQDIKDYIKLGVTEFGFNIEVYDRTLSKKYMPGKGYIPLEKYKKAMECAVSVLGKKGAVRSAFIVGLENKESLLKGIEFVCSLGVSPILSLFRPIPYTEMEYVNPPENEWILDVFNEVEKLCKKYDLKPGPECVACQNNTLSFDMLS